MIPNTTIVRMIKNKLYTGVISNGNAESEIIPELQIVDEATFQRAQELMEKRTTHHADTPLNLRGSSLLVGNIFCRTLQKPADADDLRQEVYPQRWNGAQSGQKPLSCL